MRIGLFAIGLVLSVNAYTSAAIVPGRSVTFTTDVSAAGPSFRLTYDVPAPDTLAVRFEMKPPGKSGTGS